MSNLIWDFNAPSGQQLVTRDEYNKNKKSSVNIQRQAEIKQLKQDRETERLSQYKVPLASNRQSSLTTNQSALLDTLKPNKDSGIKSLEEDLLIDTGSPTDAMPITNDGNFITNLHSNPINRGINIATDAMVKGVTLGLSDLADKGIDAAFNKILPDSMNEKRIANKEKFDITPETSFEKALSTAGEVTGGLVTGGAAFKAAAPLLGKAIAPVAKAGKAAVETAKNAPTVVKKGLGIGATITGVEMGKGATYEDYADERDTFPSRVGSSLRYGTGQTLSTAGSAFEWKGKDGIGGALKSTGESISDGFEPDAQEFSWKSFFNPDWYANNVAATVPFTASLIPVMFAGYKLGGAGAARMGASPFMKAVIASIGGAALSRPLESALEAGNTYEEALVKFNGDIEKADIAAQEVFDKNMRLMGLDATQMALAFAPSPFKATSKLGKAGMTAARLGGNILTEAGEEGYQEAIQLKALGEEVNWRDPEFLEAMAIGGLFGGVMGGAGTIAQSIQERSIERMAPEQKTIVKEAIEQNLEQGMSEDEAIDKAFDHLAETPEGRELIEAITQEFALELEEEINRQMILSNEGESAPISNMEAMEVPEGIQEPNFPIMDREVLLSPMGEVSQSGLEMPQAPFTEPNLPKSEELIGGENNIAQMKEETKQQKMSNEGTRETIKYNFKSYEEAQEAIDDYTDELIAKYGEDAVLSAPIDNPDKIGNKDYAEMIKKQIEESPLTEDEIIKNRALYEARDAIEEGEKTQSIDEMAKYINVKGDKTNDWMADNDDVKELLDEMYKDNRAQEVWGESGSKNTQELAEYIYNKLIQKTDAPSELWGNFEYALVIAANEKNSPFGRSIKPFMQQVNEIVKALTGTKEDVIQTDNQLPKEKKLSIEASQIEPQATEEATKVETPVEEKTGGLKGEIEASGASISNIKTKGSITTRKTERGTEIKAQYVVVNANDLIASHNVDSSVNKNYLSELQPRNRDRIASELQINRIANNLEPEYLGYSPKASEGSPIIGKDLMVESGNGRVIALQKVYQENSTNAEKYRNWLMDNANKFGIRKEEINKVNSPVLVQVRLSDNVDRFKFVKEANEQSIASMSATEQAKIDAENLSDGILDVFYPTEEGEILNASNRNFIRQFIGQVISPAERSKYMTSDGLISQEGVTRIKNAIFAKAFEDISAIERMSESVDNNIRNVTNALLMVAPKIAKVKAAIEEGALYALDISNETSNSVRKLSNLKLEGVSVDTFLNQQSMFEEELNLFEKDLLSIFDKNNRSAKKIFNVLNEYYDIIIALGDPKQDALWGDVQQPTQADILETVLKGMEDVSDVQEIDLFAAKRGSSPEVNRIEKAEEQRGYKTEATGIIEEEVALPEQRLSTETKMETEETIEETKNQLIVERVGQEPFIIKRNDRVKFLIGKEFTEGTIMGISRAKQEVKVRGDNYKKGDGVWLFKGFIYPLDETTTEHSKEKLSTLIENVNKDNEPPGGWGSAEKVGGEATPLTKIKNFKDTFTKGEPLTLEEVKGFVAFVMNKPQIIKNELRKKKNDELKRMITSAYRSDYSKKEDLVNAIYDDILSWLYYKLGDAKTISYVLEPGQSYEELLKNRVNLVVDNLTQEKLDELLNKSRVNREEAKVKHQEFIESISSPKTIEDYRNKKRTLGLTPEEQDALDDLIALEKKNSKKEKEVEAKEEAAKSISKAGDYEILKTKHTKTGEDLWVVKLPERLSKEDFTKLRTEMHKLKGVYSNFTKGFNFKYDPVEVLGGATEPVATPVEELKSPDKLRQLAENMQKAIDEKRANRATNTARRVRMAESSEADANALEYIQKTLKNLADGIDGGTIILLDKISARTEVEALNSVLQVARHKFASNEAEKARTESGARHDYGIYEKSRQTPFNEKMIRLAEFPIDTIWKSNLQGLVNENRNTAGLKMVSNRLQKLIDKSEGDDITLSTKQAVEDFKALVKASKYPGRYEDDLSNRNRIERLGIETTGDLRAYLREYIKHLPKAKETTKEDVIKQKERALIDKKIPGYFPTPRPVIDQMLDFAEIEEGMRVLEPSAGRGSIVDAIRETAPNTDIDVVEIDNTLRDILNDKEYNIVGYDFMKITDSNYDRVIMNPPFEKGQDIDHVRHAYGLLKPGGKLVAIMSEGSFYRSDKNAKEFQEWMNEVNAYNEKLPEKSFVGKDAERQTGVATRMVVIEKAGEAKRLEALEKQIEEEANKAIPRKTPTVGMQVNIVGTPSTEQGESFTFENSEFEKRWQEAKGINPQPLIHRLKEFAATFKNKVTREFEHLPRTAKWSIVRYALLTLQKQSGISTDRTLYFQRWIVLDLNHKEYDLFTRKVILDDLYQDLETYKEQGRELPFGLTPELLEKELERVNEKVNSNEKVLKAIEKRQRTWAEIKGDYLEAMKNIGYDASERLKRENYYHHQVLEHAQMNGRASGTGKKLKTPTNRGFLKQRQQSSLDYNTEYMQAELEVMQQMLHDIEVARVIEKVDKHHNIIEELKKKAKQMTKDNLNKVFNKERQEIVNKLKQGIRGNDYSLFEANKLDVEELSHPDFDWDSLEIVGETERVYKKFNQRIAIGFSKLKKMAIDGELWQGENDYFAKEVDMLAKDRAQGIELEETNQLYKYLSALASMKDEPGALEAAMILKNTSKRREFVKETLGSQYKTWEDIIPEGYTTWQPREGSAFHFTNSISEQLATQLFEQGLEEIGLKAEDIRKVLTIGQKYKQFVIEEELAVTLDNLKTDHAKNVFAQATKLWKILTLISPRRWFKYNLRNITGDADGLFAGNPAAFKKVPQAFEELYQVYFGDREMTPKMREWFKHGGMQTLLQAQENININEMKLFKNIVDAQASKTKVKEIPLKVWQGYWKTARMTTDLREAILRYAAFLEYYEQMENNNGTPKNYGASIPEEIDALDETGLKAFVLSNQLLGAYDQISVAGQWLRENLMPFWSWNEVNFVRYRQLVINAANDGTIASTVGKSFMIKSPIIALRFGKFAIKAMALTGIMALWNSTFFPDEEEELPEDIKSKPHIILGRNSNGEVQYIGRLGALNDMLEWFGFDEPTKDIQDYLNGRRTLKEIAIDNATKPFEKAIHAVSPFISGPMQAFIGFELFPDAFNPRKIRDRGEYLAKQFALENEYRALVGKPLKHGSYTQSWAKAITDLSNPEETNYFKMVNQKYRYLERIGKGSGHSESEKGLALYYFKQAIRFEDKQAADKYLLEYITLGGTDQGFKQSLRTLSPLYGLGDNKDNYINSLSPKDKEDLIRALEYYSKVINAADEHVKTMLAK